MLSDRQIVSFRHGRIILAANLIPLFRVDREWTTQNVLPNLDWEANFGEAQAAWTGFLWTPRLHLGLLTAIKSTFLATAGHFHQLAQFAEQYASLLTFVALEASEPFTKRELADATDQLPTKGLARCASVLVQALDGAGDKRKEYWLNRIHPYVKEIWPKSKTDMSASISHAFARLCMKAGDAFPDAVTQLKPWLSLDRHPSVTLHEFRETGLATRFPDASLSFLDAVVTSNSLLVPNDLSFSLEQIGEAKPDLTGDPKFARLQTYARQLGG
jgi:hypothetical protein